MSTENYFVDRNSIVRKIWGNGDTVLLIFAGASAEFALNKAVDWLYFTGRLPKDPLGRLFSTVQFAQDIVFSEFDSATSAIDKINKAHAAVENSRSSKIPETSYYDVLYMLIDYSVRAFEMLEYKLSSEEKNEVLYVFHRLGSRMGLRQLPDNYDQWCMERAKNMDENLNFGDLTRDLYCQYKKHLGAFRYFALLHIQSLLVPKKVSSLLHLPQISAFHALLPIYKLFRLMGLERLIKSLIMPAMYKLQIKNLDKCGA